MEPNVDRMLYVLTLCSVRKMGERVTLADFGHLLRNQQGGCIVGWFNTTDEATERHTVATVGVCDSICRSGRLVQRHFGTESVLYLEVHYTSYVVYCCRLHSIKTKRVKINGWVWYVGKRHQSHFSPIPLVDFFVKYAQCCRNCAEGKKSTT